MSRGRREDPQQVRKRLVARLVTAASTLDSQAATTALTEIGLRSWAPLDRYLNSNPDALTQRARMCP